MSQVLVLGAGIVGICCALSIRRRGHRVVLVDQAEPASGTSHGNAGVIANCAIHPLADPALIPRLPRLALNRDTRFQLEYAHLPWLAPWLGRFVRNMNQRAFDRSTRAVAGIALDAVERHRTLMQQAGAGQLLNATGWLQLLHTPRAMAGAGKLAKSLQAHGVACELLDPAGVRQLEPDLLLEPMGGLWMNDTHSVTDPAALARAYFRLFLQSGGEFRQQAARALRRAGDGWRLEIDGDPIDAEQVIVALGPWSNDLLAPLGCTLPFVQERGYHMMFEPRQGSRLHRSVVDPEAGFVLTPMVHGIRATTGSNLAARERAPNPVQLERLLPLIRRTFPIAGALLEKPWMGRRTSTTDSLPHIGPLKELPGLHVASGHCHLGLTLAPVTGELIADSVAGRNNPLARPFSPHRR